MKWPSGSPNTASRPPCSNTACPTATPKCRWRTSKWFKPEDLIGKKIGIVGSSAGGHLAASASTLARTKPAFSILFYPVITAEKGKAHQGSFNALLGDKRSAETDTWYSLQNRVSSETPPTLLLLSDDDRVVPPVNSTLYYNALKDNGVKASMHIYPTGGHGWGIRKNFKYREQWQQTVLDWLQGIAK